jgi:hypothetical protein
MTNLIKKFTALFKHDRDVYVNAARINDIYKKLERGANQINLVNNLKLDYIIVVRRGKGTGTIANIDINSDQFKPSMHNVFVKLDQLNRHKDLMKRLKELPDINNEESDHEVSDVEADDGTAQEPTVVPSAAPTVVPSVAPTNQTIELPVIELEEHERFTDMDDQVVDIEVRGERSKDKIYFNAKDVAKYFDIDRLTNRLLQSNTNYKYDTDYIILGIPNPVNYVIGDRQSPQSGVGDHTISGLGIPNVDTIHLGIPEETQSIASTQSRINHDHIFLTLAGYIRVASVSRSGNANMAKVFDWIVKIVFVHQFGSYSERNDLAHDLLKSILNDRLPGLYAMDLGTFYELYDTMNICKETYPPEQYGKYRLYKFGLSKDISTRLTQHQNKTDGYGRWSNKIVLKWMVLLSDSQLHRAEGLLSEKFKAKGLSFEYTDATGKVHNELIAVGPKDDTKVKTIYKKVLSYFPSKENDLCKIMAEMQGDHELALLKLESESAKKLHASAEKLHESERESDKKLRESAEKLHESERESAELKAALEIQRLTYENKMLQMELKLAQRSINQ